MNIFLIGCNVSSYGFFGALVISGHCGDPYQDANHIIFRCELTRYKTPPLYRYLREKFPTHPMDIFPLIMNPTPKLCRLLLSFFYSCELYI
ncbi:Uncharacterized protein DBV15_12050 [Temnothorax longispinosus]|uniref:Uncharacterized protein n=1 Tax=Temnothorax longispinosus TaxID=300112 RepID=A0A4S2KHT4_9HYME|nr:Uncharacterized protein DBV15_12050 [Temnothorax longispinosus]